MNKERKVWYNDGIRRCRARHMSLGMEVPRMPSFDTLSLTDLDLKRFWSRVDKSSECWKWTGSKTSGVGVINIGGTNYSSPRISAFISFGTKDFNGVDIVTSCGIKECVNPKHITFCPLGDRVRGNRFKHNLALKNKKPILYEERDGKPCALVPVGLKHYSLVDIEDVPKVENEMWQLSRGYAVRNKSVNNSVRKLHRMIINAPDGLFVDHISGDTLDNRKCNLRVANPSQNSLNNIHLYNHNVSGKTGVSWHEQNQVWRARIVVRGEIIEGGCFVHLNDAIRVRMELEAKHCGEFAPKRRQLSTVQG